VQQHRPHFTRTDCSAEYYSIRHSYARSLSASNRMEDGWVPSALARAYRVAVVGLFKPRSSWLTYVLWILDLKASCSCDIIKACRRRLMTLPTNTSNKSLRGYARSSEPLSGSAVRPDVPPFERFIAWFIKRRACRC
jgi:hypothetical protein